MTASIQDSKGVWGYAASQFNNRGASYVTVTAENAISAGNIVALGTATGAVIKCLSGTTASLVVGIAATTIATSGTGLVCVGGPFYGATKGTAAVTAGGILKRDTAANGGVIEITAATVVTIATDIRGFIGKAMVSASAAATTCDIWVDVTP